MNGLGRYVIALHRRWCWPALVGPMTWAVWCCFALALFLALRHAGP
jgi:hypothetical protein